MEQELLTPKQAAEYLGVSVQTLASGRSLSGSLEKVRVRPPYIKLSPGQCGRIRYTKSALDKYIQEGADAQTQYDKEKTQEAEYKKYSTKNALAIVLDLFKTKLDSAIAKLNDREQVVIKQRLGIDCECQTLDAIGKSFEITRERVRQIEDKAIIKIKRTLGDGK